MSNRTGSYSVKEIGALFGFGAGWWYHQWEGYVRAHGFPAPIAACRPRLRWSRELVDAWFRKDGAPVVPAVPPVVDHDREPNLAALDGAR